MTETTSDTLIERFDAGEDVLDCFDESAAEREEPDPNETRQISLTLPSWLIEAYDAEARRRGIARKAVINTALVEWADNLRARLPA